MAIFDDFMPQELSTFWVEQLARDDHERPEEIRADSAPAEVAFGGDLWNWATKQGTIREPQHASSVNLLFAAFKGFMPQVLSRLPKPSALTKQGPPEYAKLHNELKSYRDREFGVLDECRSALQDAFLRGTGAVYHDRDAVRGLARTKRFDVHDLYWDANATCPADAKHMIQRCTMYRWEFARRFGKKLAEKIPAKEEATSTGSQSRKSLDIIEYYLAWSKHDDDYRVFAFHKDCANYFLNEEDGRPGEAWPFVWDKEEWPISAIWFQRPQANVPWGVSYYEVSKGPLHFAQFMMTYIFAATKKFAHQTVVGPRSMHELMQKVMSDTEHLNYHEYDEAELGGRAKVSDMIDVIQFPDLNKGVFDAMNLGREMFGIVSGFNAMTQGDPAMTETATESMRLAQTAETRMSEDVNTVSAWLKRIWDKETQVDCKHAPARSVVSVGPAGLPDKLPTTVVETTLVAEGADEAEAQPAVPPLTDVPYQKAILLEKGVGDLASAQQGVAQAQEFQAAAQARELSGMPPPLDPMGMPLQPPPLDPEIAVRQEYKVALDAKCQIIEPGIEAYVGELAQFWIEDMTPRQIRAMVELRFQQGSTTKVGHVAEFNEAMALFKDAWPIYSGFQMFDKMAELLNFVLGTLENYSLDGMMTTPAELQQAVYQMQQMQMQQQAEAQMQAQQQEQGAAQQQQQAKEQEQQAQAQQAQAERQQKLQMHQQQLAAKQQSEQNRERSTRERDFLKMAADDMRAAKK